MITGLLNNAGWPANHDRAVVERIWWREGLEIPQKQARKGRLWLNDGSCVGLRPEHPDHVWSYDFVQDRTHDGRVLRTLDIIDAFTKEALVIRVKRRPNSTDVVDALTDLFILRWASKIHKVRQWRRIHRQEGPRPDRGCRAKDRLRRTGISLGERILPKLHRPVSR